MSRIVLLFAPIVLIMFMVTGVINVHTLKRNCYNAAVYSAQYIRETSGNIADSLARRFPRLFGDRY